MHILHLIGMQINPVSSIIAIYEFSYVWGVHHATRPECAAININMHTNITILLNTGFESVVSLSATAAAAVDLCPNFEAIVLHKHTQFTPYPNVA